MASQPANMPGAAVGATSPFSPPSTGYGQWVSGFPVSQSLPRPVQDFLQGAFGPMAPIVPYAIDTPDRDSGRPQPRRFQYPVGLNLPQFPGNLKLVSFANLRMYADLYSVARVCIEVRKKEIMGLDWDIVPTKEKHESMRGKPTERDEWKVRRDVVRQFFRRPDSNFQHFTSWLGALLEDIFVVDAASIYMHPTRMAGKGPFGSNLAELALLDGTTIYPLVDMHGASPRPPAPAYQQYIYGVPRSDLMAVMLESDEDRLKELGEPEKQYRGDQLLYVPFVQRSWTTYGFSPLEMAILPVTIGLKRQQWQLDYYTEGSIPGMFVVAPPDWTPQQIRQLQDALNLWAGDVAMKWKIVVLPGNTKTEPQKSPELATQADSQIIESVLMAFDIKPIEIGLLPGGSGNHGMGGKGMAEQGGKDSRRQSLRPTVTWLESAIFNYIIHENFNQRDMEFRFTGLSEDEDDKVREEILTGYTAGGIKTIDEARGELDLEPFGLPETSEPVLVTATGVVPIKGQFEVAEAAAARAAAPPPPALPPGTHVVTPSDGEPGKDGDEQNPSQGDEKPPARPPRKPVPPTNSGSAAKPGREQHDRTHETAKAALSDAVRGELDQLRNYLRHGKDAAQFVPKVLSPELVSYLGAGGREVWGAARALADSEPELLCPNPSTDGTLHAKRGGPFEYSSTQFDVSEERAAQIRVLRDRFLQDADLCEECGMEDEPHITLKYGLHTPEPRDVRALVEQEPPVTVVLGATDVFSAKDDGNMISKGTADGHKHDVVYVSVHDGTEELRRLHIALTDNLECEPDDFAYTPHMTLAYVKPGHGEGYTNKRWFAGLEMRFDHLTFSSSAGEKTRIRLAGGATKAAAKRAGSSEHRDSQLDGLMAGYGTSLGELGSQLASGKLTEEQFVDQSVGQLRELYQSALERGAADALGDDFDDDADIDVEQLAAIEALAQQQRPYLQELASSLQAASARNQHELTERDEQNLAIRLDLYTAAALSQYEHGRVMAGKQIAQGRQLLITWHAVATCCELCAERDGETYTEETLPGYPGEGSFGDLCMGGPNCRCSLEYNFGPVSVEGQPER